MLGKFLWRQDRRLEAGNENGPQRSMDERVPVSKLHAIATGAALAVSVDTSPAVLVSIHDYVLQGDRTRRRAS